VTRVTAGPIGHTKQSGRLARHRSIAIAKASAANDFSSKLVLSTANLYSFVQPANTQAATNFPAGFTVTGAPGGWRGGGGASPHQ